MNEQCSNVATLKAPKRSPSSNGISSTRFLFPTFAMNSTSSPPKFTTGSSEFFEKGHLAFENGRKSKAAEDAKESKIEQLEAKLTRKNEVLAELMEEHTLLKKELGEI